MSIPPEVNSEVTGYVEPWKPNHVCAFGSVVLYEENRYVGMGYLNNLQPNSPMLEIPFVSTYCTHLAVEGGV